MKKILHIYTLTFLFCTLLFSCEKEYIIKDYPKPRLTVNCFFNNDSFLTIRLTTTKNPYLHDNILPVKNAKISISYFKNGENNVIDNFDNDNDGNYSISVKPLINTTYHLVVTDSVYGEVKAKGYIPNNLKIDSLKSRIDVNNENEKVLKTSLFLNIKDSSFVLIRHIVRKKILSLNKDTIEISDTAWLDTNDDKFKNVLPESAINKNLFAKLNNPNDNELTFESYDGFKKDDNLIEGISYFEVIEGSEDYYKYQISKVLYNWNKTENLSSIVDPVSFYSNIEGGFGAFAGYRKKVIQQNFK